MKILDIFITELCNLSCSYCTSTNNIKSFISLNELKGIDYSNYDTINILGGEPLLHPEIIDILEFYNTMDKTIILYTNGLLIQKLNLKKYSFNNINILLTFHTFGDEVRETFEYTNTNKFYKNIRYQMLYTLSNKKNLIEFNSNKLAPEIDLGFDIYLDITIKHLIQIKKHFKNFNLKPIELLFQKKETNIIRSTDLILKSNTPITTEYSKVNSFCLLKYHFQWD